MPLLKIQKGNGTCAGISLRGFLGKGWRVNKTILHCNSAQGSSVPTSLGEAVDLLGRGDMCQELAADSTQSGNAREGSCSKSFCLDGGKLNSVGVCAFPC